MRFRLPNGQDFEGLPSLRNGSQLNRSFRQKSTRRARRRDCSVARDHRWIRRCFTCATAVTAATLEKAPERAKRLPQNLPRCVKFPVWHGLEGDSTRALGATLVIGLRHIFQSKRSLISVEWGRDRLWCDFLSFSSPALVRMVINLFTALQRELRI
jgi:hypothetical protein